MLVFFELLDLWENLIMSTGSARKHQYKHIETNFNSINSEITVVMSQTL